MLATVTEWGKKLPTSARYKMTLSFISILVYALIHTILQQELKPPLEGCPSNSGKPQDDQLLKCKSCSFHALSSRENIQLSHLYIYFNLFTTVRLSRKRSHSWSCPSRVPPSAASPRPLCYKQIQSDHWKKPRPSA